MADAVVWYSHSLESHSWSAATAASVVLVLWFGARLVVEGKLTPGELSTFIIYAIYVGGEVGSIASVISSLVQVRGAT